MYEFKMMPGQQPYTVGEQARLSRMLGAAARAEELFGEDELERYTEQQRKPKEKRKKMDRAKLVLKNGMHTVVPITLENGQPPKKFQHGGRTYELHHTLVGTGTSDIRAVYSELSKEQK